MKDPYLYEDSDILINKANIKDRILLDEFENRMTTLGLITILKTDIKIIDVKDIYQIHKTLFSNVYEWAGKKRTINIFKNEPILNGLSVDYTNFNQINKELETVEVRYFKQKWELLSKEDFMHLFTRMIAKIWQIHPFREGNTRVISAFGLLFMKQNGYKFDADIIAKNAKYFRNALVMASLNEYAEYHYLQNILLDAVKGKLIVPSSSKYNKIKNYDVNKYEYNYHEVKK
ncbi:MAG: Fic family protein [Candidatus Izemoplasmatales bacterium]|jgi:cell filamentation protein|nr:Fic family protein [Candidatus Izemoplasmatales bacterium]